MLCSGCRNLDVSRILFPERQMVSKDVQLPTEQCIVLGPPDHVAYRARTCHLCRFIASLVRELDRLPLSDFQPWQTLLSTTCEFFWKPYGCKLSEKDGPSTLRYRLDLRLNYEMSEGPPEMRRRYHAFLNKGKYRHMPNVLQPSLWPVPSLECQMEDSTKYDPDLRGGRYRPLTCDPRALKGWMRTCEERHEQCQLKNNSMIMRLRIIDTRSRCLRQVHISNDKGLRYVALSYVWGKDAQSLTLKKKNCVQLGEPGALHLDCLPQTIVDAIKVVEMLGECYLWVDALCIIQDDKDDKAIYIPSMGHIYGGAVLTIAAASGTDANSGLPGVQRSRSPQHVFGPLSGGALMTCCTPEVQDNPSESPHYLAKSKWDSRGWTLQEKHFSRRCLYFMKEQIYWECQADSWCEESCFESVTSESEVGKRRSWLESHRSQSPPLSPTCLEKIGEATAITNSEVSNYFSSMVKKFSPRSFTFEGDAESAFGGFFKTLIDKTGAQFWHGIPISTFDSSVLWDDFTASVQRPVTNWPSWSWLAWQGNLSIDTGEAQHDWSQIVCYRPVLARTGQMFLERVSSEDLGSGNFRVVTKRDIWPAVWMSLRPKFHILFWAQTCVMDVRQGGGIICRVSRDSTEDEELFYEQSGAISSWVSYNPYLNGPYEFVLVAKSQRDYGLLLLSWHNGIAKRVSSAWVKADEWDEGASEWKLIIMG